MFGVLISTDTIEHFHQHRTELYRTMPWPCSKTQALRILWVAGPESGPCAGLFSGSVLLKVDHIAGIRTHRPERWLRGEARRGNLGAHELGSSSPCTAWTAGESENLNPSLAFQAFVMMYLSKQAGRISFTEQLCSWCIWFKCFGRWDLNLHLYFCPRPHSVIKHSLSLTHG